MQVIRLTWPLSSADKTCSNGIVFYLVTRKALRIYPFRKWVRRPLFASFTAVMGANIPSVRDQSERIFLATRETLKFPAPYLVNFQDPLDHLNSDGYCLFEGEEPSCGNSVDHNKIASSDAGICIADPLRLQPLAPTGSKLLWNRQGSAWSALGDDTILLTSKRVRRRLRAILGTV